MKPFRWGPDKNEQLKLERGVSFEQMVVAVEAGGLLDILAHPNESDLIAAFEKGTLKSVATKAELSKFRAAARATAIKDRRVKIRLSNGDLQDIQVKALQEGMPYQTLIASVLHTYVTGRLVEREVQPRAPAARQSKAAGRRASRTDV